MDHCGLEIEKLETGLSGEEENAAIDLKRLIRDCLREDLFVEIRKGLLALGYFVEVIPDPLIFVYSLVYVKEFIS